MLWCLNLEMVFPMNLTWDPRIVRFPRTRSEWVLCTATFCSHSQLWILNKFKSKSSRIAELIKGILSISASSIFDQDSGLSIYQTSGYMSSSAEELYQQTASSSVHWAIEILRRTTTRMTVFYPLITSTSISKAKSLLPKIGEFFWSPMRNANVATGAGFCKKKTSSNDILANG